MKPRRIITGICRVIVSLLFIFSGLVKADDPLGFAYKLQEYFIVFHLPALSSLAIYLSMFFCTLEIMLGVLLLLGILRNFTAWALLVLIIFFSFLTFYTAWFNKVTECGCFGDAIQMTPWQSFSKNVVLLILILVIVANRKLIRPLFAKNTGTTIAWIALLLAIALNLYAYIFLPPINFRPYKKGNDIDQMMKLPANAVKDSVVMTFVYEKNGHKKELSIDQLSQIDSTWHFKKRIDKLIRQGDRPLIHDFAIYKQDGTDVTQQFLNDSGYKLLIIQYDLEHTAAHVQPKLNALVLALPPQIKIWPLTASSIELIDFYTKTYQVPYTYYQMDNTVLKTIIRSNPGLLLLKGNTIKERWPSTWLPSAKELADYLKD